MGKHFRCVHVHRPFGRVFSVKAGMSTLPLHCSWRPCWVSVPARCMGHLIISDQNSLLGTEECLLVYTKLYIAAHRMSKSAKLAQGFINKSVQMICLITEQNILTDVLFKTAADTILHNHHSQIDWSEGVWLLFYKGVALTVIPNAIVTFTLVYLV